MLGKPDRYRYTDPANLMNINPGVFIQGPKRLTDYHIPV